MDIPLPENLRAMELRIYDEKRGISRVVRLFGTAEDLELMDLLFTKTAQGMPIKVYESHKEDGHEH